MHARGGEMCVFVFAPGHVICEGGRERVSQKMSRIYVCVCVYVLYVLREKVETLISWHEMSGRKDG